MSDETNSIDIETLLSITRQKLITAVLANTELEALVQELRGRVENLETGKKEDN